MATKEELQERAQLVRIHEANCAIEHPTPDEANFRVAIMKKLGSEYRLKELRSAAIDGPVASELETLRGKPRLIAIARNDPSLAIALDHLLDQLVEADFARACEVSEELSHRIRTHYLASRSDKEGVAR